MPRNRIHYDEVLPGSDRDKRLEIMRALNQGGSISEAARACGVSYKAAWQALDTLSNLAGVALVDKVVGGSGGGGARLTAAGQQVLQTADALDAARRQTLQQILHRQGPLGLDLKSLWAVGLRTSLRNQLPCRVRRVERSAGVARVTLELADGQCLTARITLESLQLLDLKVGRPALALFKATAVTVAPTIVAMGGINLLRGQVQRRGAGAAGTEISLLLSPGLQVVGMAEAGQAVRLRQPAMAAVEDSAVVVALAG